MPREHKKQGHCEHLTFASVTHAAGPLPGEPQELYLCFSSGCRRKGYVPAWGTLR